MRKVIVCQDKAYGASKGSATEHTALSPADLAVGAVGIYGIPYVSANNKDKSALITEGGADAAGLVPDASFDGPAIFINVGTEIGNQSSFAIEPGGVNVHRAVAYVAPVYQVHKIGKNLNTPATVNQYDESQVRITDFENTDQGGSIKTEHINSSIYAVDSEGDYSLLLKHVVDLNLHPYQWVLATIESTTAGAVFAATATVTAVNGAVSLVTSAAHGVGVGDYVRLTGSNGVEDTYLAVTGTAASLLVLDSPYRGATETVVNADTKDLGTATGEVALVLTSLVLGKNFGFSASGLFESADHLAVTAGTEGQGSGILVQREENLQRGYKGTSISRDRTIPFEDLKAVEGTNYDVYVFNLRTVAQGNSGSTAGKAHKLYNELVVAFPDGGSATGQGDFEKILGEILYGTTDLGDLYT